MDGNRGVEGPAGSRSHPVNRWLVAGTAGVWLLVFLLAVVRFVRTERVNATSVLLSLAGLLQAGSLAAQRKELKRLLAVCGGIVAATTLVLLLLQRI